MKILLLGGTGFIGKKLSRELSERGHSVTVVSREPEKKEIQEEIKKVSGDVTEYQSIDPAFESQDVVVNLVALSPLFIPKGGEIMHEKVHLEGTKNIINASESHDIEKIVQISALGADPEGSTSYIRAKGKAERAVKNSDIDSIIHKPSIVFGEGGELIKFTKKLTTPYVTGLPGSGKTKFQPIWVDDLVSIIANSIEEEKYVNETYEIGGPEVLTLSEVAKEIYRSEGKDLKVIPIPMFLAKIGLELGGIIPGFPMGKDQYKSLKLDNTVRKNDVEKFGIEPEKLLTFSEYLAKVKS